MPVLLALVDVPEAPLLLVLLLLLLLLLPHATRNNVTASAAVSGSNQRLALAKITHETDSPLSGDVDGDGLKVVTRGALAPASPASCVPCEPVKAASRSLPGDTP